MNDAVEHKVKQIASDLFDLPISRISAQTSTADVAHWDSVLQLSLVLSLEQAFGVQFEPEEIERMGNVGVVMDVVRGKIGAVKNPNQ